MAYDCGSHVVKALELIFAESRHTAAKILGELKKALDKYITGVLLEMAHNVAMLSNRVAAVCAASLSGLLSPVLGQPE